MPPDFSAKNFKEFCEINELEQNEARIIVFQEIDRLYQEIKSEKRGDL